MKSLGRNFSFPAIHLVLILIFILVLIPDIQAGKKDKVRLGKWRKVGENYEFDISGIVFLERKNDINYYLVCHDNKYQDEDRIGIISIGKNTKPHYRALTWPDTIKKPIDMESLSHFCWENGDTSYLSMTSKGLVTHFTLDDERTKIIVHEMHQLPKTREKINFEGISALLIDNKVLGVWAHRGKDDQPGIIYWGWIYQDGKFDVDILDSLEYKVPWPQLSEVRHVSEVKLDEAGVLYCTAASEASDDGPFAGACYIVGAFNICDKEVTFKANSKPVRIFAFDGYKVEAFDFVPGPYGGIIFGTDNENDGAYLYYYD